MLLKMPDLMFSFFDFSFFLLNDCFQSLFFLFKDYILINSLLQPKTPILPLLNILKSISQNPIDPLILSQQVIHFVLHLRQPLLLSFLILDLQIFELSTQCVILINLITDYLVQSLYLNTRVVQHSFVFRDFFKLNISPSFLFF